MEQHRANMAALIERDRNYLEIYTPDGRPYRGRALPLSRRRRHDLVGDVPRPLPLVAPRRRRGVRLLFLQVAALSRFARERLGRRALEHLLDHVLDARPGTAPTT